MISFLTGISASVLHVISGPDHLAAVTPLALKSRLKSWLVGLFWGVGHTIGAMLIGVLFYFSRELIPVEIISEYSEKLVGIILIVIGVWAIVKIGKVHHHHHHKEISNSKSILTSLSIGIVHGLAGVSHLIGVLPTLALPTKADAVYYLTGFGVGTILAMVTYSFILGFITHRSSVNNKFILFKRINFTGGVFAILVGLYWIGITMV